MDRIELRFPRPIYNVFLGLLHEAWEYQLAGPSRLACVISELTLRAGNPRHSLAWLFNDFFRV